MGGWPRLFLRRSGSPSSPWVTLGPQRRLLQQFPGGPHSSLDARGLFSAGPGPPWAAGDRLRRHTPSCLPILVCGVGATSVRKGPKINGPLI